jgi:subtilase family serine protease
MFCPVKCALVFLLLVGASSGSFAQNGPKSPILQAIDRNQTAVVRGSAHPLAKPEFDAGRVDGSMKINGVSLNFSLSSEQQTALQALLREQLDRSSPLYHQWLTPEQYADRFGMSQSDLARVTSWLQSEGFKIDSISRSRTRISFSGTASQIEVSFRTEIHHYLVNGAMHFANSTELSVPEAFGAIVLFIGNLSDLPARRSDFSISNQPHTSLSPHYTEGTSGIHFLAPADFATIYDLNPLYSAGLNGAGQSIAVMGQSAIFASDLADFRTAANLPPLIQFPAPSWNLQQILVPGSGTASVFPPALIEADLDLEWAEAVAPNVNLLFVFVGSAPNFNAFDALKYTIDQNLAPIVSITYGVCEQVLGNTEALVIQQEVQQANSQGQTVIAASGDEGAADCDGKVASATLGLAVDVPASIPEVTGVGGTEFTGDNTGSSTYWNITNAADGGSALSYIPEMSWNDSVANMQLSASGGGASTFFPKPAWQVGLNIPDDSVRDVPDIALSASPDHDPYLICSNASCVNGGFTDSSGNLLHTGGTSFGAPAFAGVVAIINQRTNSSQGNVNPTLYSLAETTPAAFHDITTGTNFVPCTALSPNCPNSGIMGFFAGPGYDQATGLGSLDANVLVNAWPVNYSISVNPTRVTIAAPGAQGTAAILLNPIFGFTGSVNLACTPQSGVKGLTCQISPNVVTATSANATLTISTVGAGPAAALSPVPHSGWFIASSSLFVGIFLFETPFWRRLRLCLPLLLLLALIATGVGCGGGSSSSHGTSPNTPPGLYTVTVTGTSGSTSFTTNVIVGVL